MQLGTQVKPKFEESWLSEKAGTACPGHPFWQSRDSKLSAPLLQDLWSTVEVSSQLGRAETCTRAFLQHVLLRIDVRSEHNTCAVCCKLPASSIVITLPHDFVSRNTKPCMRLQWWQALSEFLSAGTAVPVGCLPSGVCFCSQQ